MIDWTQRFLSDNDRILGAGEHGIVTSETTITSGPSNYGIEIQADGGSAWLSPGGEFRDIDRAYFFIGNGDVIYLDGTEYTVSDPPPVYAILGRNQWAGTLFQLPGGTQDFIGDSFGMFAQRATLSGQNDVLIYGLVSDGMEFSGIENYINNRIIAGNSDGAVTKWIRNFLNNGQIVGRAIQSLTNPGSGLTVRRMEGFVNRGLIEGERGISLERFVGDGFSGNSDMVNAGIVRSLHGPDGDAIWSFGDFDDYLALAQGNLIIGNIGFGAGTDTLQVGTGVNLRYTFRDIHTYGNTGTGPTVIDTETGWPENLVITSGLFATRRNDAQTVLLAVADKTAFSKVDDILAAFTGNLNNSRRLGSSAGDRPAGLLENTGYPMDLGGPDGETTILRTPARGATFWAQTFAATSSDTGDNDTHPSDLNLYGLLAGIDVVTRKGLTVGAFLGTGETRLEVAGQKAHSVTSFTSGEIIQVPDTGEQLTTDATVAGLYGRYNQGNSEIDLSMTFGWTDTNHDRVILDNTLATGFEFVTGDYEGLFLAPELAWTLSPDSLHGLIASLRGGYTAYQINTYKETGANGIKVGKRDLHMLQARAELARPFDLAAGSAGVFTVTPYGGMDIRHLLEGDKITLDLLGNGMSTFALGQDKTELTGFAGLRLSARVSDSLALEANIEGRLSEDETETISGSVGGVWKF